MPTVTYPLDCLNAVHNCLQLCFDFTPDEIQESAGSPASLALQYVTLDTLQDGSTLTINGTTFYFVTGIPNANSNEIQIGGAAAITAANIQAALEANYQLCDKFSFTTLVASLQITAVECDYCIDVSVTKLDSVFGDLAFYNNGSPIILKEDARICANIICCFSGEEIEIDIPIKVELSEDGCEVVSGTAKKDISQLLKRCVKTPLPDCSQNNIPAVNDRNEMVDTISLQYTVASGKPLNFFDKQEVDKAFTIYNGLYQDNEDFRLTEYCGKAPKPLTIYEGLSPVGCGQCMPVYLKLNGSTTHSVQISLCLYDSAGVLLGIVPYTEIATPDPIEGNISGVVEVQTGLHQLGGLIDPIGVDIREVSSYTVKLLDVTDGGNIIYDEIQRDVKCCDAAEMFVFLTSLGTYETILLNPILSSNKIVEQNFIEQCQPCQSGSTDRQIVTTESSSYRDFQTSIKTKMEYSQKIIDEFLTSTDIYWCIDDELYWVQPTISSYQDFDSRRKLNIPFSFRMFSQKAFSQVC